MIVDLVVRAATATPTPTPSGYPDPNSVTPGLVGFLAFFFVVAATVLLVIDMTRRVRRTRYRAEIAARLDAEEAEAHGNAPGSGEDTRQPL